MLERIHLFSKANVAIEMIELSQRVISRDAIFGRPVADGILLFSGRRFCSGSSILPQPSRTSPGIRTSRRV